MNVAELCVNCKQNNSCTMCWKTSNKKCPHFIQKTNADRFRAMSDEELAKWLVDLHTICECCSTQERCEIVKSNDFCRQHILDWLKQPAKEDAE